MSVRKPFSKSQLDAYLKELGKEFRRLGGRKAEAEIILVGGASVLVNYTFRDMTNDADAIIQSSSALEDAIRNVGNKFELLPGWLNTDFKKTASYTPKLREYSIPYRTFSNALYVRTVSDEYLVAMKLMAGRQYKHDLSDIVGILWEHQKKDTPLSKKRIENAVLTLYDDRPLPSVTQQLLEDIFTHDDLESAYQQLRNQEEDAREILRVFNKEYPRALSEESIDSVLDMMRKKRAETQS